ncbi:unnamed protein product [Ceratitis capitata]|uniref:(Mediterranean fruit fly) hypothetical protein n=1 Tax=Ceratitis capitata TaxID=7213 RepID=A0A811V991_CERCA|nr:unnamed protein product [Ceratitis capitata]
MADGSHAARSTQHICSPSSLQLKEMHEQTLPPTLFCCELGLCSMHAEKGKQERGNGSTTSAALLICAFRSLFRLCISEKRRPASRKVPATPLSRRKFVVQFQIPKFNKGDATATAAVESVYAKSKRFCLYSEFPVFSGRVVPRSAVALEYFISPSGPINVAKIIHQQTITDINFATATTMPYNGASNGSGGGGGGGGGGISDGPQNKKIRTGVQQPGEADAHLHARFARNLFQIVSPQILIVVPSSRNFLANGVC